MLIENLSLENVHDCPDNMFLDTEYIISHILSSSELKNIKTLEEFHDLAREHFVKARRREVECIIKWINEGFVLSFLVLQPDDSLCFATEFVEFNDSFVTIFLQNFFDDPPFTYLQYDPLLRMFYSPNMFISVMKKWTDLSSESRAILKLLVDRSFEQEKQSLLNKKECASI